MIAPREEIDLLRAAILQDQETVATAWRRWSHAVGLDDLNPAQFPLMPRLYANLVRYGLGQEAEGRIKGIYRRTWYRNQQASSCLKEVLIDFHRQDVPLQVIGDMAVCLDCYPSLSERPVEQLDVLTQPERLGKALGLLLEAGWQSPYPATQVQSASYQRFRHRVILQKPDQPLPLGLHWRIVPDGPLRSAQQRWWKLAFPSGRGSSELPTASPETALVMAGRGLIAGGKLRLLAAADLGVILLHPERISWESVMAQARWLQAAHPLSRALLTVSNALNIEIPDGVITELKVLAKGEITLAPVPSPGYARFPHRVVFHLGRWRRILYAQNERPTLRNLLHYLRMH